MSADAGTQAKIDTAKAGSAWLGVGLASSTDWAQIASMLAALYTLLLIVEWLWRKLLRPVAEARGWVKRRKRRASDRDGEDTDRGGLL